MTSCVPAVQRLRRRLLPVLAIAAVIAACGGDKKKGGITEPGTGDGTVASVQVTAPGTAMQVGGTLQLSGSARNASGAEVAGKPLTWQSSSDAVASVSASGMVTAKAPGSATITATEPGSGKSGSATVTVSAVPVATVELAPGTLTLTLGGSQPLALTARDAQGNVLAGRTGTVVSSNPSVATVNGLTVTAVTLGSAVITATVEGKIATANVTVTNPEAARLVIAPSFLRVDVGATGTLAASAFSSTGIALVNPSVAWTSLGTSVASVNGNGFVGGVAVGDTRVVAQVNAATDTALVAVLGPQSLLGTALPGGEARLDVKAGSTFTVPVVLDLSKVSANGDLGAAQLQLGYDPAVLSLQTVTTLGGADYNNVAATGTFRLAFAGSAPQGSARVTLATLTFQVAPGTAAGTQRALSLSFTARPANTAVQLYDLPVSVAGRIRVVN